MRTRPRFWSFVATAVLSVCTMPAPQAISAKGPATGPQTEKRFPPLKVPKGFRATLFACDPLVEYPSVIAVGPKPGTLFVAHDYVTGLGIKIVRRDEVRLLRDTDGDGYADKSTLFAGGFNSIQGLAYDKGTLFVMHAPLLTALQDTNGDGAADTRRDIVKGLGLPPEKNPNRLHCANGVVAGHDGWLYLALGDRGCDVKRPEGDRLLFQQGGILRCRPDGRDLHVFAGGLRNTYDVALDAELNVFVRDNENDGGDYMIRVCRSFFGADHGYPYLYRERPDEALRPLADLGRGSSAGGTSYLETAFPQPFRESLFFCEWGRAVVRYHKSRAGSHFADMKEVDFAAGAPNDPYGFKPTDVVVDHDGSLLISDWGDGQRPKRGRGRIYRIVYVGEDVKPGAHTRVSRKATVKALLAALNAPSYFARVAAQRELARRGTAVLPALQAALKDRRLKPLGRLHAIWLLAGLRGTKATEELFGIAQDDGEARVRAQAVRALADLTDPILVRHRLSAGRGDAKIAARFAALVTQKQDPRVVLEVLVALSRLRWPDAPGWLSKRWETIPHDPSILHAAQQLLRRCNNWPAVLKLLDGPSSTKIGRTALRTLALRAVADRADATIVDGLIARLKTEKDATRRSEYVHALSRVYKKPAAWTYWGFRPAPRPANSVGWDRTAAIGKALEGALAGPAASVRITALRRMRRENVPVPRDALAGWLKTERHSDRVNAILEALADFPVAKVRGLLERIVRDKGHSPSNRLTALRLVAPEKPGASTGRFFALAKSLEDGPVLAAAIRELGRRKIIDSDAFLLKKLSSREAVVRAAAARGLAERGTQAAAEHVVRLLSDSDVRVQRSAAFAAGKLNVAKALPRLRALAAGDDRESIRLSLDALRALGDARALPQAVAALKHPETQIAALSYLEAFGNLKQLADVTRLAGSVRSSDVLAGVARVLSQWRSNLPPRSPKHHQLQRAVATVHGRTGMLLQWLVIGPVSDNKANRLAKTMAVAVPGELFVPSREWRLKTALGTDASLRLSADGKSSATWVGLSDVFSENAANVEFLAGAGGTMRVWLNGKEVHRKKDRGAYRANAERFEASLVKGINRILVRINGPSRGTRFHLRFRAKSSKAEHERLIRLALGGRGSALRGRELFFNAEKSQCIKCHHMDDKGGRIGPDLTGVGSRFSKIHLVESLLEPGRTIAHSYATYSVALSSGRVISGVKVAETPKTLTLGDTEGKTHVIPRSDVELMRRQSKSTMPDGLEKRLTDREFLDLIAFLVSQKKRPTGR